MSFVYNYTSDRKSAPSLWNWLNKFKAQNVENSQENCMPELLGHFFSCASVSNSVILEFFS